MKGWATVALADVARIERRIVEARAIRAGTLYVGLENILSGGQLADVREVSAGELASSKFAFTQHHVLYGKLRPYLAKIARPTFSGICSTDILPVKPGPNLDRSFLAHLLLQRRMVDLASSLATGVNLPRLSANALEAFEIPLPGVGEQRRIAAILDQADTLRSQRRKALNLLSDLRASIFASMFGSLDNPAFRLGSIRNYVDASSGKSSKGVVARERSAFPIYGGNGINGWATRALYDVPVLVFGRVGQQCGNAFLTDGPAWVTDNAIVVQIRNMDALHPRFVLDAFSHTDFARRVRHLDLPFINQSMILDTPIVLPQIALQLEYVERVVEVDRLSASHRASLAHLDALFASVQHRAFGGEL